MKIVIYLSYKDDKKEKKSVNLSESDIQSICIFIV